MKYLALTIIFCCIWLSACSPQKPLSQSSTPEVAATLSPDASGSVFWQDATVYFMMLDRFNNGDTSNDKAYNRVEKSDFQRGFHGGDLRGVIDKLDQGYFNDLNVDAIWFTPIVEQIHGQDLGWGATYAYHGYWPKDWTNVDEAFGTEADLKELIDKAHQRGIKILLDVIINHTGPVTSIDQKWPDNWVRMEPVCNWASYQGNVSCALNSNLPDIRTEINEDVALPPFLIQKWQQEGRLAQEQQELDKFFARTGLSRAPKNYIVKWLTDWVKEYGVDGFRVDTAKHVEADIWKVLKQEAQYSLQQWRTQHPEKVKHTMPFFMVGEVMHFGVNGFKNTPSGTRLYDYSDKQVDFYANGMDSLINMGFPVHAALDYESLFALYSQQLHQGPLKGVGVMNYVISHDDPEPYDAERAKPFETANKLVLSPGAVQIYYGDELSREINFSDPSDARLRLPIDWQEAEKPATQAILQHWKKLTNFRQQHPAVGLGQHKMLSRQPYVFSRTLHAQDKVVVGLELKAGKKRINVGQVWPNNTQLYDYYSGQNTFVNQGFIEIDSPFEQLLIGQIKH